MEPANKAPKTIQSVSRALDLLECICESGYGYRLGELAERCGLNKTTAFHLLKTLEARGYVEQSYDTQFYKLGWKSFDLFTSLYEDVDIRSVALPYMERIRAATGETVTLYYYLHVEDTYMGVCLMQLPSAQPLKFSCKLGSRIPLHCTAAGKVRFLGYPPAMLREELDKTPDPAALEQTLEQIRQTGCCIEREEHLPGICSVAVPLFKYTGRVSYSLCVSVPTARAAEPRLAEIARTMQTILQDSRSYPDFLYRTPPILPPQAAQ